MVPEVTKTEWDLAEAFFKKNTDSVKFSRHHGKDSLSSSFLDSEACSSFIQSQNQGKSEKEINSMPHSFVKIGSEIFAVQPGGIHLGEGAFGRVKEVQNRAGESLAIKIEGGGIEQKADDDKIFDELARLDELGQLKGQVVRDIDPERTVEFKGKLVDQKKYTVQTLVKGKELHKRLEEGVTPYSQRLFYGLVACKRIHELHQKNMLHCDIKSGNILATDSDIQAIDFGFSIKLKPGEETRILTTKDGQAMSVGSPEYMAPEIAVFKKDVYGDLVEQQIEQVDANGNVITSVAPILLTQQGHYSKQSDIYALGEMLRIDLLLNQNDTEYVEGYEVSPIGAMSALNKDDRPSLPEVMVYMHEELRKYLVTKDIDELNQNIEDAEFMMSMHESKRKQCETTIGRLDIKLSLLKEGPDQASIREELQQEREALIDEMIGAMNEITDYEQIIEINKNDKFMCENALTLCEPWLPEITAENNANKSATIQAEPEVVTTQTQQHQEMKDLVSKQKQKIDELLVQKTDKSQSPRTVVGIGFQAVKTNQACLTLSSLSQEMDNLLTNADRLNPNDMATKMEKLLNEAINAVDSPALKQTFLEFKSEKSPSPAPGKENIIIPPKNKS